MSGCTLCPRRCGADRAGGKRGRCHVSDKLYVARAALHFWEEPCISGGRGSGAVFFSGCALGCVFCQNRQISRGEVGVAVSVKELSDILLDLQGQGAHNVNLVTAGHYLGAVAVAIEEAKAAGLTVPVVWNSSGYESVEALRRLEGLVDVYLPDLKYLDGVLSKQYSKAADYPQTAKAAIAEMVRQQPVPRFDAEGMMVSGVVVRHLLLPGHVREAKHVVNWLFETFGEGIFVSLLNQYTPTEAVAGDPLLYRRVTKREYGRLVDYAIELGVTQGFYQEGDTAKESFIPPFPQAERS